MNKFEEMKREILQDYPPVRTLSLWNRLCLLLSKPVETEHTVIHHKKSIENARLPETYSQSAILIDWKGKTYLKRFGRLGS